MKKIISLLAASVMAVSLSATAFAAVPTDAAPKASIVVEDTKAEASGGYLTYTMTIDLKDLGSLSHTGVQVGPLTKYSGDKIATAKFVVEATDVWFLGASGALGSAGWDYSGNEDPNTGTNIIGYFNATAVDKNYPLTASANSCDDAMVITFMAKPDATLKIKSAELGYVTYVNSAVSGTAEYVSVTCDKTEFDLANLNKPAAQLTFTADLINKFDNGYVWAAAVTKGEADLATLTAKFEDGTHSTEKTVRNISALNTLAGAGAVNFNIGLKTTKTLTKADFTLTDAANGTVTVNGLAE